jgi:DNA helicase HerA-like ATPase
VWLYLHDTPFEDFFNIPLPFSIPLKTRFSHTHILGGSGHGKTQLMQNFILSDLQMLADGKASVIVIDSQGDLFRNVQRLAAVGEIADRVVFIDPNETESPPALNLFDFGLDRVDRYSPLEREMLLNGAVALYEYIFGAVLGAGLTAKQGVIFGYLAHLMMVVPDATIDTLMDFMQEPDKVRPYLPKLDDPVTKRFFETQFFHKSFDDTREQILYRVFDVLKTRALSRMFRNKRNKLNLFEAMNRGSLILINTAKDLLKQEGTEILGRFFIALIAQAAQERASIPVENRMPTFVYIDEAHDYFDESMETLLEQARKYNVGLVIAHQHLAQFETSLRSTVGTNTAIKIAGGLSQEDARALAGNMRTTPEFLLSMRKHEGEKKTEFACFVRDLTGHAIALTVPLGAYDGLPKLTPQALDDLKAQNRARVCQTGDDPDNPPPPANGSPPDKPELL